MTAEPLAIHPVANIIPAYGPFEYAALVDDIRAHGLIDPIWLNEGQIIDGRHRYRACLEAGVAPRFRQWNGPGSLVQFVVSVNLRRRHLTEDQLAFVALAVERAFAEEASERQRRAVAEANRRRGQSDHSRGAESAEDPYETEPSRMDSTTPVPERARAATVRTTGVSHYRLRAAKKVAEKAPELGEQVQAGTLPLAEAVKQVNTQERVRQAAVPKPQVARALLPVTLEVADARKLPLAPQSVDLVLTSPPYGLDKPYTVLHEDGDLLLMCCQRCGNFELPLSAEAWEETLEQGWIHCPRCGEHLNTETLASFDPAVGWEALLVDALREAYRVTKRGGRLALNVPLDTTEPFERPTYAQAVEAAIKAGWIYKTTIIWNKNHIGKSTSRGSLDSAAAPHVITRVEMIAIFYREEWHREGPRTVNRDDWLEWTNGFWTFPGQAHGWEDRPAPFPEELPHRLISLFSFPGDVVLDPFVGSGTTVVVAHRLGRKAIGYDRSAQYIEAAARRMAASLGEGQP